MCRESNPKKTRQITDEIALGGTPPERAACSVGRPHHEQSTNTESSEIPKNTAPRQKSVSPSTTAEIGVDSKAKTISKDTYVLLNVIHSFRNRDEHPEDQKMHVGVAVSAVMACIELLDCLARELA